MALTEEQNDLLPDLMRQALQNQQENNLLKIINVMSDESKEEVYKLCEASLLAFVQKQRMMLKRQLKQLEDAKGGK